MNHISKIKYTIDALFGRGVSKYLPKDINITFSKKNGRIRSVYHNERLLFTLRIDGGLAISPYFAQLLLQSKQFKKHCLEIDEDSKPFVEKGKSVFCGHVIWCGENIKIASETPILFKGEVIAVGKAILSTKMILAMKRGIAVRIRKSLN